MRDGPSNSAQDFAVGELKAGQIVEALEHGSAPDGSLRIRVEVGELRGWVNLSTKLGASLLVPLSQTGVTGRESNVANEVILNSVELLMSQLDAMSAEESSC